MPSFNTFSRFLSKPSTPARRQAQAPRGLLLGLGLLLAPMASFAQYQVAGSAATSTTCTNGGYTLTTNAGNLAGAVWNTNQLSLNNNFTLTGNVYLGASDAGADGITFTLQRRATNPTTAVGGTGLNLGVSGITPSLSVEVDTYQNDPAYDPVADHISIFQGGSANTPLAFTAPDNTSVKSIAAAVDGAGNALNIENNTYYPFKVIWTASSKTLQVFFNDVLRATYTNDLVTNVFGGNSSVYWGFTGATGGSTNLQEVCGLNLSVVTPLPVMLTEFTAQATGAGAHLQWATASELNTARFEVQRSIDGQTFTQRGTLPAAGNSASTRYYTYQDTNLPTGTPTVYYRLRQVDRDGTFTFSPVRAVQTTAATLVVFPNPARQEASVSGLAPYAPVQLLDALGRPVAQATADEAGKAKLLFAANQPSGVYVVRSGQQVLRLVVE